MTILGGGWNITIYWVFIYYSNKTTAKNYCFNNFKLYELEQRRKNDFLGRGAEGRLVRLDGWHKNTYTIRTETWKNVF